YVKECGVSERSDVGAVGDEQESEDKQKLGSGGFDLKAHQVFAAGVRPDTPGGREQVYASRGRGQATIFILIGRFLSIIRNGISPTTRLVARARFLCRGFVPSVFEWGSRTQSPRHEKHAVATTLGQTA